jgi:alcohol dehydrogenase
MTGQVSILRPPRTVLFGRGTVQALGEVAAEYGDRAIICTDPYLAATPIMNAVLESLRAAGVAPTIFDGVIPDVPVDVLEESVAAARKVQSPMIIGVGGGSSLDVAKLTALLVRYPGPLDDYYGENRVPGPVVPIIAVPTTSGTGSEVTPVAVVTDPRRELKVGVSSRHLVPVACICDPALTDGCPPSVTAHSGIDALAHAIEALTAVRRDSESPSTLALGRVFIGENPLSRMFALEATMRIGRSLGQAVAHGDDRAARDDMAYGSLLAGLAFATAGTSLAHALQYPLGARTDTPHGLGVGLLLPYAMAFNSPVCRDDLTAVATALGYSPKEIVDDDGPDLAIKRVADLCAQIGIPASLRQLGVAREDLEPMAIQALGVTRLVENNRRPLDQAALLAVLEAAWFGDRSHLAKYDEMSGTGKTPPSKRS